MMRAILVMSVVACGQSRSDPAPPAAAPPKPASPAQPVPPPVSPPAPEPPKYVFYCQARLHADPRSQPIDPMPSSECSVPNRCMKYVDSSGVKITKTELTVASRCLTVRHAFCFAFVEPSVGASAVDERVRKQVEDGTARCFLSAFDCLDAWNALGEARTKPAPVGVVRTDCTMF
jgi:hypothetical protein